MTSEPLNDLLHQAVEKIAKLEDFPPDWKDWRYWEEERLRQRDNVFPSPHDLTSYIKGHRRISEAFSDLLIPRVFDSHGDPRDHPLWELTFEIGLHPDLEGSDSEEQFLLHCSRENLYLKTFSFEFLFLEEPEGGKVVEGKLSCPENVLDPACKRAKKFLQNESDRLAERFGFREPYYAELGQPLSSEWASEPKKNIPPRITSTDRVV